MLVENENYFVSVESTDKGLVYTVTHQEHNVVECRTQSLTFANTYAVVANRAINTQIWNGDLGEDLMGLGNNFDDKKKHN